jgi:hypothetical protein
VEILLRLPDIFQEEPFAMIAAGVFVRNGSDIRKPARPLRRTTRRQGFSRRCFTQQLSNSSNRGLIVDPSDRADLFGRLFSGPVST